jgi:hypothetical protein
MSEYVDIEADADAPSIHICLWSKHNEAIENIPSAAVILFPGWRQAICACQDCRRLLGETSLLFLYGEDPILEPEVDPEAHLSSFERK